VKISSDLLCSLENGPFLIYIKLLSRYFGQLELLAFKRSHTNVRRDSWIVFQTGTESFGWSQPPSQLLQ